MCLAIPGRVIEVDDGVAWLRTGKIDFGGVVKEVSLALVPEAAIGDYVIVHVGMALSRIAEEEAQQVFAFLQQMQPEDAP
ncbi:MAG: HypC/HybG/HupF family hydrogenase formation chaperone [Planctomycetes bacterium]|nr:HypC/HybG/HupF family hydrogenase formation chaperone [Planctomycetota bacterium]